LAQKVQATVQQLYKEVPEVPMVVEATIEEQVENISEAIQGLHKKDHRDRSEHNTRDTTRRKSAKGKDCTDNGGED
jgi:hypothetical protein